MPKEAARDKRKERIGVVVSDKMEKTITVRVDRVYSHPQYTRTMRASKKYKVHDDKNSAGVGDLVRIVETRPISKTKRWRLAEVVKKAV